MFGNWLSVRITKLMGGMGSYAYIKMIKVTTLTS